ncbi:hypothetical protein Syun_029569 [Stephania yunnanensis]|uniref:Uncharacterized protein n=1 Tax=Stephania yunnanensis TaxID=152371 RepID=A0AAP0E5L9_9MAGN
MNKIESNMQIVFEIDMERGMANRGNSRRGNAESGHKTPVGRSPARGFASFIGLMGRKVSRSS